MFLVLELDLENAKYEADLARRSTLPENLKHLELKLSEMERERDLRQGAESTFFIFLFFNFASSPLYRQSSRMALRKVNEPNAQILNQQNQTILNLKQTVATKEFQLNRYQSKH